MIILAFRVSKLHTLDYKQNSKCHPNIIFYQQCLLASSNHLSSQQLNTTISSVSGLQSGSDEHTELVGIFKQLTPKQSAGGTSGNKDARHPVILVLDKVKSSCMIHTVQFRY